MCIVMCISLCLYFRSVKLNVSSLEIEARSQIKQEGESQYRIMLIRLIEYIPTPPNQGPSRESKQCVRTHIHQQAEQHWGVICFNLETTAENMASDQTLTNQHTASVLHVYMNLNPC